MESYPLPDNEDERLSSLKELNLLDTPAEERFDRITRLACDALEVSYSAINLVDTDRQWGKSTCGLEETEGPREQSFCTHAIMNESTMVIPDARDDDRFEDNPFVLDEPNIRFYMGHPIHSEKNHRIGTLCVFDPEPRKPDETQKRIMHDLASIADSELQRNELDVERTRLREKLEEAERRSRIDKLTNLWNRRAVFELIEAEMNRSNRDGLPLGLAMLDLDDFKSVNDTFGHPAGDEVLKVTAERIRQSTREYDVVGRYGGEEFIALFPETDRTEVKPVAERICTTIRETDIRYDDSRINVTVSVGISDVKAAETNQPDSLLQEADQALYAAKNSGKDTVCEFPTEELSRPK